MPKIQKPPEWGVEPVPRNFRNLRALDLFVFWTSLGTGLLVYEAGGLIVPGLDFTSALLAIIAGTLVGTIPLALAGLIGSEHAIPTMVSLRPSFGLRGSYLPTGLNIIQLIGWGSLEIVVMAKAADLVFTSAIGFSNYPIWVLVFAALTILMGIGGPLMVIKQWLEKFAFWILYGSAIWIAFWALQDGGLDRVLNSKPGGGLPLLLAIDLVLAMPLSWMPLAADYNRFSRSAKSGFLGTFIGFAFGNIAGYTIGSILILSTGSSNVIDAFKMLYLGIPALILIVVYELDNGFADIYSAAVSIQNSVPRVRQWKLILGVGVACTFIALLISIENYISFLLWIGATFTPIFGVVLSHYFIVAKRRIVVDEIYKAGGAYWYIGGFNLVAILAWALGFTTYVLIAVYKPWLGATIPSLGVSFLANTMLMKMIGAKARMEVLKHEGV